MDILHHKVTYFHTSAKELAPETVSWGSSKALQSDMLFHPLYLDQDNGNKALARLSHQHSLETCQDRHRPIHQPDQSTLHWDINHIISKHRWDLYKWQLSHFHHFWPTPGHTWAISVATTPWCSGSGLPYHCWRDLGGWQWFGSWRRLLSVDGNISPVYDSTFVAL